MRKFSSFILIGSLALLISGCDHYSAKLAMVEQPNMGNVANIMPAAGAEMNFSSYLEQEYYQMALVEQNVNYDYPAAKNYFMKAERLANGKMVAPDKVNSQILDSKETNELSIAREALETALLDDRIPENRYALARAQGRFDCWVDEAEEMNKASMCSVEFKQAMNSIVLPLPPEAQYMMDPAMYPAQSYVTEQGAGVENPRAVSYPIQ